MPDPTHEEARLYLRRINNSMSGGLAPFDDQGRMISGVQSVTINNEAGEIATVTITLICDARLPGRGVAIVVDDTAA